MQQRAERSSERSGAVEHTHNETCAEPEWEHVCAEPEWEHCIAVLRSHPTNFHGGTPILVNMLLLFMDEL